ncbi:MAG: aspartate--tRNA ligase [Bacteroidales bacterium]|nr:aspartate--tRNA ligase [Bacteroidales bacterium]
MYRTHNCGELRHNDINAEVTLSGWIQKIRDLGAMTFIDLRDRYGITQLFFNKDRNPELHSKVENLGREFVIQIKGKVTERSSKNPGISTGDIEITVSDLKILSKSELPPFTIENETDGGEEIRLKYRYLDLRRRKVQKGIILRNNMAQEIRKYLIKQDFLEIETPFLIKSTPEGARDFVVPSRMNEGKFYALPQSPQVFKQLLMIAGYDKYFQLTKCFRDEDFRADRQPEFTQIDCEMSFVEREDILILFEGLAKFLFTVIKDINFTEQFPRITYDNALTLYGSDRPDIRFDMKIADLTETVKGNSFKVFDDAEFIGGICAEGLANYSRKQTDNLIKWVQRPQIGAKGLVFAKYNEDGTFKSSVDKFYSQESLKKWASTMNAKPGDLMLLMSGNKKKTLLALGELRLEMGTRLEFRDDNKFAPLWVIDFPLFEKEEETGQLHAVHHPFTSPKKDQFDLIDTNPEAIKAEAYDLVINGNEIGGGSIRIHDTELQKKVFKILGFTEEGAKAQFGFLMDAFKYGAPPHGGIAFGFDRWVALFNGSESIRDIIAFPKNNAGRDIMIDAPAKIDAEQLRDLNLSVVKN